MSTSTDLLFLGLPETGKTSYFLALDEVLQSEQHGLISNGFAANRIYLEQAKIMWRAGEVISRTNLTPSSEPIELLVRHRTSDAVARLVAPDVYGEFYDDQWADRKWPIAYRKRLSALAGILLFVNAVKVGRIPEMTAYWRSLPPPESAKRWEPRASAPQIKLVDLLQNIAEKGGAKKALPVSVMISAWDTIESYEKPKIRPEEFFQKEWSLLHQYLISNPEIFDHRTYGVSACGGVTASGQDKNDQAKLVLVPPHERVWLKDETGATRDITRPVRWLLG